MTPQSRKVSILGAAFAAGLIGFSSCQTTTTEPPQGDSSKEVAQEMGKSSTPSKSKSTKTVSSSRPKSSKPKTSTPPKSGGGGGNTHMVKSGETLWDIARQYNPKGTDYGALEDYVSATRKLNDLPGELAPAGTKLNLPPLQKSTPVKSTTPPPPTSPSPPSGGGNSHVVESGETLWDIARAKNPGADYASLESYVGETRKLNDLPGELAPAGATLKLPEPGSLSSSSAADSKSHTVKPGETLWDIARMNNPGASYDDLESYVGEVRKLNDLPGELAPAGETLKLP